MNNNMKPSFSPGKADRQNGKPPRAYSDASVMPRQSQKPTPVFGSTSQNQEKSKRRPPARQAGFPPKINAQKLSPEKSSTQVNPHPKQPILDDVYKATPKQVVKHKQAKASHALEDWELEKLAGAKVYKLTAYTTTDNINQKFKRQQRQVALRKVLVAIIILLALLTLAGKLLDLTEVGNLEKIIGQQNTLEDISLPTEDAP